MTVWGAVMEHLSSSDELDLPGVVVMSGDQEGAGAIRLSGDQE